ncbi:MAG: ribulose-phosphate 3-epimerase [Syntrophothermus sp.]
MKLIAPSVLASDFSNLLPQIRSAEIGGADWLHCDVMDGHFVPNITFGPFIVKALKKVSALPLDCHLMIENPDNFIKEFAASGADVITVHQEAVVHLNRTVQHIKEQGVKAGVSVNPSTPVSSLFEIAEYIDLVLIMSVNPGFGGQKFIESSLRKIRELAEFRYKAGLDFLIEVDGGIDKTNIERVSDAGCDVFVAGTSIFRAENISAAAAELKNLVNSKNV